MSTQSISLIRVILAIFLPPIAAFLQVGISAHLFINIVLTILGGVPGMIHALWLVVKSHRLRPLAGP